MYSGVNGITFDKCALLFFIILFLLLFWGRGFGVGTALNELD